MAQSGTGQAMLSTDVVREAEFLDSEIFIDYAKPMRLGFFWSVGGVIPVEPKVMGAIGIHRPRGARPFEAAKQHPPRHAVTSPVAGDGSATQTPRPY